MRDHRPAAPAWSGRLGGERSKQQQQQLNWISFLWLAHRVMLQVVWDGYTWLTLSPLHTLLTPAARVLPAIQESAPGLRQGDLGNCQLEGAFVYRLKTARSKQPFSPLDLCFQDVAANLAASK